MKNTRIFILFLTLTTMAANLSARSLTERQLRLAACACLEAQGDQQRLSDALHLAFDAGVTVAELKEAFSQLYAYTGFPRSLNALGTLRQVMDKRAAAGQAVEEGRPWKRPAVWDDAEAALRLGTENQTRLSGQPFNYTFCPQDDHYLKAHLFGDIFAGDALSAADRELVTVAALSGLKDVATQLAAHKRGAVNMGNTEEQINELLGWLRGQGYSLVSEFEPGSPNTAYARYFTGDSYLNALRPANLAPDQATALPLSNVTFEPGCRNHWHIHRGARQILICVSGKGWYQEWGKPAVELRPGTVIDIPEGVKHWHGAQADSWMQHLTAHIATQSGQSNEWLEPVTDEQYNQAGTR